MMRRQFLAVALSVTIFSAAYGALVHAETPEELFKKGQTAYNEGRMPEALEYFKSVTQADDTYSDAYFNQAAIYFNMKRYPESLETFNKLLQRDPNDQAARYETGRVLESMGRTKEAITAYELVSPTSSRYKQAQENIHRLQSSQTTATSVQKPAEKESVGTKPTPANASAQTTKVVSRPVNTKPIVQEFASGFYGPTGVAVDAKGTVYVANFSKNTIYKVEPNGQKTLWVSGVGINGPVGMTLDQESGDLYIANHLDNSVARISPDGKVSIIATGLKKPYNIYLDQTSHTLYVSQQETNSIAKIKLN